MIRVLHLVYGMNRGGIETFIMNIYRQIDREKIQFDFLLFKEDGAVDDYQEEILTLGGKVYRIKPRSLKKFNMKENKKELDNFFKMHPEYEIVHFHESSLCYTMPLRVAKKNGVPTRIIHSHNIFSGLSRMYDSIHKWNQLSLRKYATDFFACSEPAAQYLFGDRIPASEYKIVKNGIDLNNFKFSSIDRKRVREEYGIQDDEVVIGHIGRFAKQKNHSFIIDIFKVFNDKNPKSTLLLVGGGELRKEIEEKVVNLGLENKVIFAGIQGDTPALYSAMDIFLFPSLYEGLGIVLVEAQTSELPCVVSSTTPTEVRLTERFEFVSLESTPEQWSEVLFNYLKQNPREGKIEPSLENYDIRKVTKMLSEFYLSQLKKD